MRISLVTCITIFAQFLSHQSMGDSAPLEDESPRNYSNSVQQIGLYSNREETDQLLNRKWVSSILAWGFGQDFLYANDLTGSGVSELVISSRIEWPRSRIHIISNDLQNTLCAFDYEEFDDLIVVPPTATGPAEIYFSDGSSASRYDTESCTLIESITLPKETVHSALGDLDADGEIEIVISTNSQTHVFPWGSPGESEVIGNFSAEKFLISESDNEGNVSIYAYDGTVLRVLDGQSYSLIYQLIDPSIHRFDLADLTTNDHHELIVGYEWDDGVRAIEIPSGSQLFQHPVFNLSSITAAPLAGSEFDEVIYGEDQWGDIFSISSSGAVSQLFENPAHGIWDIHVDDFIQNGDSDLIWTTTGKNDGSLFIGDISTQQFHARIWGRPAPYFSGGFMGIGEQEASNLAYAFRERHGFSEPGAFVLLDRISGNRISEWSEFDEILGLDSAIKADGNSNRFCAATRELVDGFINVGCFELEENGFQEIWSNSLDQIPAGLKSGYLGSNEREDIVVLFEDGSIRAYSSDDGEELWASTLVQNVWGSRNIRFSNDALWVNYHDSIWKLDPINGATLATNQFSGVEAIAARDNLVIAAYADQGIGILNPSTLEISELLLTTELEVVRLRISEDGRALMVLVPDIHGSFGETYFVELKEGYPVSYAGNFPRDNEYFPSANEIIFFTSGGVDSYELILSESLFSDGFE